MPPPPALTDLAGSVSADVEELTAAAAGQVDTARINADPNQWRDEVAAAGANLLTFQRASVALAPQYVAAAMRAQNADDTTDATVDESAFVDFTDGGGSWLRNLVYAPPATFQQAILQGLAAQVANLRAAYAARAIIENAMRDAHRSAVGTAMATSRSAKGYVRALRGTSCARCAVLAGRRYRVAAFARHPRQPMRLLHDPRRRRCPRIMDDRPGPLLPAPLHRGAGPAVHQGGGPGDPTWRGHRPGRERPRRHRGRVRVRPRRRDRHRRDHRARRGRLTPGPRRDHQVGWPVSDGDYPPVDTGSDFPARRRGGLGPSRGAAPAAPIRLRDLTRDAPDLTPPVEDGAMPPETEPTPPAPQQPAVPPSPTPAPPTATPPLPPVAPVVPATPGEDALGDPGKAALQAERTAKKAAEKKAADLESRLRAIEDKDKTDLERAQSRLAELERDFAAEQQQRLRLQIATAHSISADDLVLLTGSSEDELTAQAARIAALRAQQAPSPLPVFAPSAGQHAGNGAPGPAKPSVVAGRDMFRARRQPAAPSR